MNRGIGGDPVHHSAKKWEENKKQEYGKNLCGSYPE